MDTLSFSFHFRHQTGGKIRGIKSPQANRRPSPLIGQQEWRERETKMKKINSPGGASGSRKNVKTFSESPHPAAHLHIKII